MSAHSKILLPILKNIEHSIGCEVGVHAGDTAKFLLKNLGTIEKYYAIDPWKIYDMYDGKKYRKPGHKKYKTMQAAMENFLTMTTPYKNKVVTLRMTSVDACKNIPDGHLDWIFIDANHEYEYIKENLILWTPKVKQGGLVSGHDYGNKWQGIKKAVDEFVPKDKLKIYPETIWAFTNGDF